MPKFATKAADNMAFIDGQLQEWSLCFQNWMARFL